VQWSKYWVNTLTASPLVSNRQYLTDTLVDVVDSLDSLETQLMHGGRFGMGGAGGARDGPKFADLVRDSGKIATESLHGLMNQVVKDVLFNPTRMFLKPKVA
jgi:COP9 signalosome complex subunit 5